MAELIDVLPSHRFDENKLWRFLRSYLEDFGVPPTIRQFQGGQSNPTYLISTPARKYVLRKQPSGKLLPSAHAMDRE
ncbi:MAG: phosphotransferase, partial [Rhodomicrobium sp.]